MNSAEAVPAAFVAVILTVPVFCGDSDLSASVEVLSRDSITVVDVCVTTLPFSVHSTFGVGVPAMLTGIVTVPPALAT